MSIYTVSFGHQTILRVLKAAREDQVDVIPEGFSNSIRWNAGHILVITDSVLSCARGHQSVLPPSYLDYFGMGTSPKTWKDMPPSIEDICGIFEKQLEQIRNNFEGKEDEKLEKLFQLKGATFETVKDILSFVCFHTGMHLNIMLAYLRLTK